MFTRIYAFNKFIIFFSKLSFIEVVFVFEDEFMGRKMKMRLLRLKKIIKNEEK